MSGRDEMPNKICHHYWQRDQDSGRYNCRRCGIPQNVDCKTMDINNHNNAREGERDGLRDIIRVAR